MANINTLEKFKFLAGRVRGKDEEPLDYLRFIFKTVKAKLGFNKFNSIFLTLTKDRCTTAKQWSINASRVEDLDLWATVFEDYYDEVCSSKD